MSANEEYIKQLLKERAEAEADRQALIEEFKRNVPKEWTPEDLKDKVRELLAIAYARIKATIDSENEQLAYRAAKDVFDIGIGRVAITDDNDPNKEFTELLKAMKPKTATEKVLEEVIDKERAKHIKNERDTDMPDATPPDDSGSDNGDNASPSSK